jgi:hypothetical protein
MQLTDDDLQEFCQIWKAEFKEDLTPEQARQQASQLLELCALLARPLPSEIQSPLPSEKSHL